MNKQLHHQTAHLLNQIDSGLFTDKPEHADMIIMDALNGFLRGEIIPTANEHLIICRWLLAERYFKYLKDAIGSFTAQGKTEAFYVIDPSVNPVPLTISDIDRALKGYLQPHILRYLDGIPGQRVLAANTFLKLIGPNGLITPQGVEVVDGVIFDSLALGGNYE